MEGNQGALDPYQHIVWGPDRYYGFLSDRGPFAGTEFSHVERICRIMERFGLRLQQRQYLKGIITFNQDFSKLPRDCYQCRFSFDDLWWSVDIYVKTFENPRDNDEEWKQIVINLPNDGFIYSFENYGRGRNELKEVALELLIESAKKAFPPLMADKSFVYQYYRVGHDRINLVFWDQAKKQELIIKFEYYPPVGN